MVSGSALTASSRAGHTREALVKTAGKSEIMPPDLENGPNPCVPSQAVSNFAQTAPVNERTV